MDSPHQDFTRLPGACLAASLEATGAAVAFGPAADQLRGAAARVAGTTFATPEGDSLEQALGAAHAAGEGTDEDPIHVLAFDLGGSGAQNLLHRVQRTGVPGVIVYVALPVSPQEGGAPSACSEQRDRPGAPGCCERRQTQAR